MLVKNVKTDNAHNGEVQGNYNPAYDGTGDGTEESVDVKNANNLAKSVAVEIELKKEPTEYVPYNIAEIEKNTKDHKRPTWGNGLEFLMSCISLSVGIGNIWRFPFTAYENGGGAFVIPYLIVLIFIGRPMYYLEMAIGQFINKGPVKVWELSPFMKGIGIGQAVAVCCIVSYYAVLLAITLSYIVASFSSTLPWAGCEAFADTDCVPSVPSLNGTDVPQSNDSMSSSELYFLRQVLHETDDISNGIGYPDLKLSIYLFIAWALVFLVMVRGVKSTGKASYFLALFPYVVLFILLGKALTLDGAMDGIIFFLKPKWSELLQPKVWRKAVEQCFFSLSVALGPIFMFSSYNQFDHNIYRDAAIVSITDTFTSLLGGVTVFGILGSLAHSTKKPIENVIKGGTGLAFVSYPDAIAKFTFAPQLFSLLFFVMLLTLGIGSCVGMCSSPITAIWDHFPKQKYWKFSLVFCIFGFLSGLIYVTPGGQWMLTLVDEYGGVFLVLALAISEIVIISWVYGLENICIDIEFMTKRHVGWYWRICWGIITPLCMIFLFFYALISYEIPTYGGKEFPSEFYAFGWCLFVVGIIQVPLWFVYERLHKKHSIALGLKPSPKWGPKALNNKLAWMKYKKEKLDQREKKCDIQNFSTFKKHLYTLLGLFE